MDWKRIWIPQLPILEVIFRSAIVFLFIHISFRVIGRRELSRYSIFNVSILFLIAVALRMTLVANDTSVTSGLVSLSTILCLDWLFSYVTFKSERVSDWVEGPPHRLIHNGIFDEKQLHHARMSKRRLLSELRLLGCWHLEDVEEAYLESNGRISFKLKKRVESV